MGPNELIEIIHSKRVKVDHLPLVFDDSYGIPEELRLKAIASLMRLNPQAAGPYFTRINSDRIGDAIDQNRIEPDLIALATRLFNNEPRIIDAAIKSTRTPTKALLLILEKATQAQISALARDELRLVLAPDLLQALLLHENINDIERDKLETLFHKIKTDREFQIRHGLRPENLSPADRALLLHDHESEEGSKNLFMKVMKMSAAEKALLALFGNREARFLLVRDSNTLVAKAVIRSPRLTENDVVHISQMREVDEDILRSIAENRRWSRNYTISRNLTFNPRTPPPVAISLLERMRNFDIKSASRDHNISHAVRQAAMRIAKRRGLN